jgi:hypothetical protein
MSEIAEDHWIWDGMILDQSQQSDFMDGLLKLSHAINNGQHPTAQKRADRPRPIRFQELHKAVCTVIASLVYFSKGEAGSIVWRPLGAENYTGGEVSRKQFKRVVSYLTEHGYLQVSSQGHDYGLRETLKSFDPKAKPEVIKDGVRGHGKATRWVTTESWSKICDEGLGLRDSNVLSHFVSPPTHPKPKELTSVVVLRKPEPSADQLAHLETQPAFQEQVRLMEDLNEWLLSFTCSGLSFNGLQRHFHRLSSQHYGRLHAPFQNMKSETRRYLIETGQLRINDCRVAEVDVSSSQPHLLWGRYCFDKEPDWHDLYRVIMERMSRINYPGLTRELIKKDVVEMIGRKAAATRTHSKTEDPNKVERQRLIVERTPWLNGYFDDEAYSQAQLVHTESEALLMAMQILRKGGIPSLPIHDSLIVGQTAPDAAERAIGALQTAWAAHSARWAKAERKA